jgi:sugar lactone lactonase YvrE
VTTLAGSAGQTGTTDGTGSGARFNYPFGVALDGGGNLYVADTANHTVRKVTPEGAVTTLAGDPTLTDQDGYPLSGYADGSGSAARFNSPIALAVDSAGRVYVADSGNYTIRQATSAGVVTTLAGNPTLVGGDDGTGNAARFNYPTSIATDKAGALYVADAFNHTIRKLTAGGVVTTLAGFAGIPTIQPTCCRTTKATYTWRTAATTRFGK